MKQNYKDKIIESTISALILFFLPFVLSKINWDNFNLAKSCPELFEQKISYFVLIISVIAAVALIWLLDHIIHKSNRKQKNIEKELKKFNQYNDKQTGVLYTWDVYLGSIYDNNPFISNIKCFCTKHNAPILMENGCCQDPRCPNNNLHIDEHALKKDIEARLFLIKRELEK